MVRVFFLDTSLLYDDDLFQRHLDSLSPERKEKAIKMIFRKDRNLSLGSSILLRHGLELYGIDERTVSYGQGPFGKPFINGHREIHFSISHSSNLAMVAFSDVEIGCDIEKIDAQNVEIAQKTFCKNEYKNIVYCTTEEEKNTMFHRIWTLKESYVKAIGLGLSCPFDCFEISLGNAGAQLVAGPVTENISLLEIDVGTNYRSSVCIVGEESGVSVKDINCAWLSLDCP